MPNNTEITTKRITLLLAALTLLAPAGYLIGLNYYVGRLSALGVNGSVFPFSMQDAYVYAYYTIGFWLHELSISLREFLVSLLVWPNNLLTVAVISALTAFFYGLIKLIRLAKKDKLTPFFHKYFSVLSFLHWGNNDFSKSVSIVGLTSYTLSSILLALVYLFALWFIFPTMAYKTGVAKTEKMRLEYLEKGCYQNADTQWNNCHKLISANGEEMYEGILISQSSEYIALFTKKGSMVMRTPAASVVVKSFSTGNGNQTPVDNH
ncbi:hypothetical protein MIB92_12105 [Aestuariirhabdus sp. Z084]|uniref:hypothetical protein n=1 Tax=Aestuariirhabdus haliotis TaxID=2918751 RepID=UPI00201B3F22|nr:hypothetical protein [Aestuariirhabdus haliotis]MCL6416396.1 hypothetical protein [Aestuariirhabdus haliotis]MCL6420438.1 hypothetical protein [Aestuariirhabdus haliotis]